MIVATDTTIEFLKMQSSIDNIAKEFGVTKQTLFNIKSGKRVSSEMIEKIIRHTGFTFDNAFVIKD